MAVPAKFRAKISGGAVITRGLDRCLFIFNASEWEKFAQKIIAMPVAKSDPRSFNRFMFANAVDVEFDSQGRILIPDYLRKFAGLKKEAVVTGVYNRIEVWDSEAWAEYNARVENQSDEIAERLTEMGI